MIEDKMNGKQKLIVVVMDLLLLIELAVAVYLGYQHQENLTVIFLRTYVPAMLVTVILARISIRKLSTQG
ncbi:MAG: hypothetical protein NWR42_10535 [Desulfobacterales bacterium]|nr:hypothetical protein [Desulfobacterales bacterium]